MSPELRSVAAPQTTPDWLDRVGPDLRRVLDDALIRAGLPGQVGFSAAAASGGVPRSAIKPSRQAQHARLGRVRSTAIVATAFLCGHDDAFIDALLHPDAVWLRPLCADTHTKSRYFAHLMNMNDASGYERLFDRSFSLLSELAPSLEHASVETALRGYSALAGMFFATSIFGSAFAQRWHEAFAHAQRSGMLDNPLLRLQLATMGSFAGRCDAHVSLLLEESNLRTELADMYCFVRRDAGGNLYELQASLMRGRTVDPEQCLLATRPSSTVRRLADYALACMRDPQHFCNAGLTLMVLIWVDAVRKYARSAVRSGAAADEVRTWSDLLKKIERVQLMEKTRFFATVDSLPEGAASARLLSLWTQQ